MRFMVDIDGTICNNTNGDYENAKPYTNRIKRMNQLYEEGNEVHYWTARGMNSGKDWQELTRKQFKEWGIKYTSLNFNKPAYDLRIDDKCINEKLFFGVDR